MRKLLSLIFILCMFTIVNADEDKNYVYRKQIAEMQKKIDEYKKKTSESKKQIKDFSASHVERIKKRKSDIVDLTEDVTTLERELREKKIKNASQKRSLKNSEMRFAAFKKSLRKSMNQTEQSISEFPYNIEERNANISRLILDSELEGIPALELFNRYYNYLNRDLLTGMDSEVFVKNNVKYLRIGWVILCYTDENKDEEGLLLMKNNKWEWNTKLDFSTRKAIRDSIKMVEGKKAPEMIEFPVPVSVIKNKGGIK